MEHSTGMKFRTADLVKQAERAPAFRSLIDPDNDLFFRPGDMPTRIAEFCALTHQPVPQSHGEFVRCVLASLALKYRFQLERLETLLNKPLDMIHMVGGGIRNQTLVSIHGRCDKACGDDRARRSNGVGQCGDADVRARKDWLAGART